MNQGHKDASLAGFGLIFGVAFGCIFGSALGNAGLGISLGAALGLLFAPAVKKNRKPPTRA
jgi:hypothetical protein